MRVAIIGATGFVGRHLRDACIQRGYDVAALARSTSAVEELFGQGVAVFQGDIGDLDIVSRVCAGADVVFNVAGVLAKWRTSHGELARVNARSAGEVVKCAASAGAGLVVHASTAGVSGPLPAKTIADESYACAPSTEYQKTKLAGERAASEAHLEFGIPLVIVRPTFVYGPGDQHKLAMFRAVGSRRVLLVNRGSSLLHPVYVDDLISGMLLAAERGRGSGDVYILAGDKPASTRGLLTTIANELGVPAPRVSLPEGPVLCLASMAESVGRAIGKEPPLTCSKVKLFSENYAYSTNRARTELGYIPSINLREGIWRTVEWYTANGLLKSKG